MNDFFKISIAEAFDEYELHCKAEIYLKTH